MGIPYQRYRLFQSSSAKEVQAFIDRETQLGYAVVGFAVVATGNFLWFSQELFVLMERKP